MLESIKRARVVADESTETTLGPSGVEAQAEDKSLTCLCGCGRITIVDFASATNILGDPLTSQYNL